MKKLIITAVAVAATASIALAATTAASNIVGYTKVTVDGGDLALIAVNLDNPTTLADLIGTSVPALSSVFKWDKGSDSYVTSTLSGRGAWSPNSTLEAGEAFFIKPAGAGTHDIVISGEVITTDAVISLPAAGLRATGYYFPVSQAWQSTELAGDLPGLSSLSVWDQGAQGYVTYTKSGRGLWNGNPVIDPAEAFFVNNPGAALDSTNTVPFTP